VLSLLQSKAHDFLKQRQQIYSFEARLRVGRNSSKPLIPKPLESAQGGAVQHAVESVIWLAGRFIECSFFRRIQDLTNKPGYENIEEEYEYIMNMLQCLMDPKTATRVYRTLWFSKWFSCTGRSINEI